MIALKITGMNCHHCVRAVEDALSKVPGVTGIPLVDLAGGRAMVAGDPEPAALLAAVAAAGYQAEPIAE